MNKILLVGNPNTGKTTFFNTLCKANEHIGNWHGVTVDAKSKVIKLDDKQVEVVDLPGLYSLTNYSFEEKVSKEFLYSTDDLCLNICDANNLSRNLFLTLQLLEMGKKVVMIVNMKKEFLKAKKRLDIEKLSKKLDMPIYFLDAVDKKQVKNCVIEILKTDVVRSKIQLDYISKLSINKLKQKLGKEDNFFVSDVYESIKLLEQDEYVIEKCMLDDNQKTLIKTQFDYTDKVAFYRYEFIEKIMSVCYENVGVYGKSKIDKILLNKFLALPIFICILALIFFLTFSSVGALLTDALALATENLFSKPLYNLIAGITNNDFILSFFSDGLIGGVVSVINFLPQVVLLFMFFDILEQSGYMSRLAFTLEDFFAKIGLSGKSVFTLLMGFGCATTASLTSRNLEDKNGKIKTAILTPYLSCSAKLPLYATICGAFFVKTKTIVVLSMYLLGVVVALIMSLILNKTVLKTGEQSFLLEFPPYRRPSIKRLLKNICTNAKQFIVRVGSVMLCFSIIIWFMQNCNFKLQFGADDTILKVLGQIIAPILTPLGLNSWGIACSLLCGIVAKEMIVSTIGIVNNVSSISSISISESLLIATSSICFSKTTALSYLVFSLLYFPCASTIAVFRQEIGTKWTIFACFIQLLSAYAITFVIYRVYSYFVCNGIVAGILSLLIFILISVAFIYGFVVLFNKRKNKKCTRCVICKNKCPK